MNAIDRLNAIENNTKEEISNSENEEDDGVRFYDMNGKLLKINMKGLINFLISHNMH